MEAAALSQFAMRGAGAPRHVRCLMSSHDSEEAVLLGALVVCAPPHERLLQRGPRVARSYGAPRAPGRAGLLVRRGQRGGRPRREARRGSASTAVRAAKAGPRSV